MKQKFLLISILPLFILYRLYYNPVVSGDNNSKASLLGIKKVVASNTWQISLNGIDSTTAHDMKKQFWKYKGQDKNPRRASVWFDISTIRKMLNMLDNEITQEKPGPHGEGVTDGIRIYFTSDLKTNSGHLNNSIILVSTKYAKPYSGAPSGANHVDYYTHFKSDPLFNNLSSIQGSVMRRQLLNTRGENLYNINFDQTDDPNCMDPHHISRKTGHQMLNEFGKDTIITKSEWFSLDFFRLLAKDTVVNKIRTDGIRIYFARHTKNDTLYPDTDAFIITTTRYRKYLKVHHADYFDCLATIPKKTSPRIFANSYSIVSSVGGDDKGELCPENCNPTDTTDFSLSRAKKAAVKSKSIKKSTKQ